MKLKSYTHKTCDTRGDLLATAGFWVEVIGGKKTALLAILGSASLITAEKTGMNDMIRDKISSVLMTPPEQGGPMEPIHRSIRKNCHPDGQTIK